MYLILEYVDEEDLLFTKRNNHIYEDDQNKIILKQISTCVEYLHYHCKINRDLNANSNLLIG
jgi:serine/threonine protein kinase